jgi:hypothetical protein
MPKKTERLPSLLAVEARWEVLKEEGYAAEGLEIRSAGSKGLGVFALRNFDVGEVVEYCHCIPLATPSKYMADSGIKQYAYWDRSGPDVDRHGGAGLVVLGYGSVVNSADSEAEMNCKSYVSAGSRLVAFVACRRIRAGEEIVTWWGQAYYDSWCKNG